MVVILVALTFLTVISVRALLSYLARRREVSRARLWRGEMTLSPVAATPVPGRALQFPNHLYYHGGHAWVKLEEGNRIRVGLDDFTQQVMGEIEDIEVPAIGSTVNRGEVAWRLRHGRRKLSQLAPSCGTVVEVNQKLKQDPSLVNRSPYEEGWVLKIQPKALKEDVPELMDSFQFRRHFDQIKATLRSSFNDEALGRVYGDGEEVIRGAADKLDERWWRILVTQLFHSSPE